MSTATEARDLTKILAEAKKISDEYKGKVMPTEVGEQYKRLCQEGNALQEREKIDAEFKKLEQFSREIPDPVLPATGEQKSRDAVSEVAGYVDVGTLFVFSEIYQKYLERGAPIENTAPVAADVLVKARDGKFYVPLNADERKSVTTMIREVKSQATRERKAVPTLNTGVLDAQRLDLVSYVTMPDRLRIRDVLNVSQTNASSVEYLEETSYTRAAAPVAASAAKPQASAAYSIQTATVRTHAVWIPVTEQMLQDAPAIINLVNNRLTWDLDKLLEEQVVYGSGSGQNFTGIMNTTGVLAARTGDQNLDSILMAATDVRRAGYEPNAVVIDPIDWEGIVLLKGTDDHYIWAVVTDAVGERVWGLRVVQSIGAEENAGNTTEERNIVVGDFMRGATLWERTRIQVAMGWINDDFTKNQRTIRAERRAAFAVHAPKAFRFINTVVAAP